MSDDAPKRTDRIPTPTAEATTIQNNSTVRSGTSARSSIRPTRRQCFRFPKRRSVPPKTVARSSERRSLRCFFVFPLASPVWATMRVRIHDPRTAVRKKSEASRTRAPTATARPSGPPGPYAFAGTSFEGSDGDDEPLLRGIKTCSNAEPWPTTDALSWIRSPGRAAVTYWTRQVRFSTSAIVLYTDLRSEADAAP